MNTSLKNERIVAHKRVFGLMEFFFDLAYLALALVMGIYMLSHEAESLFLPGIAALILVFGDAFHLVPRMASIVSKRAERFRIALGIGKLVTSITMSVFYLILWYILTIHLTIPHERYMSAIMAALCGIRILFCFQKENEWLEEEPDVRYGIIRNIPFFIMGLITAVAALVFGSGGHFFLVGIAVLLSFLFYTPVVLYVHKNRKLGMLMLPKSLAYLWILYLLMSL